MNCQPHRYSNMKDKEKRLDEITKDFWYVKPLAYILRFFLGSDKPSGVR